MSWSDRLREAAYTSPGGVRTVFEYEDVSRSIDKRTAGFDFPDADGTYVQDLGHSGRKYPLRLFFWGANYDTEAEAFETTLLERGAGRLEHPVYGAVDVVPYGSINRRDDLVSGANQAVIEVTFWETIGVVYPLAQVDKAGAVLAAVEDYNQAAALQFAEAIGLTSVGRVAAFKAKYSALLASVKGGLQKIADAQDNVRRQFAAIGDSIDRGLDTLIDDPLALALQTLQLIQSPARALTSVQARLKAYLDLITAAVTSTAENALEFNTTDLYTPGYITASVVAVVNNQFNTKTEALDAADGIFAQFEQVAQWQEAGYTTHGGIDTGGGYQMLQRAVALTAGYLVEISFTLKQERRVVLDRARTIIDLAAELYGSVDDQLDFLIDSNNLTGSEILELPRGREIVYYI